MADSDELRGREFVLLSVPANTGHDPYKTTGAGVDKQAAKIPDSVKAVVRGLSNEYKQALIVLLLKNYRPWSFDEICREFEIENDPDEKDEVLTALGDMQDGGLVQRIETEDRYQTKYKATELAVDVTEQLFESLRPKHAEPDDQ